MQLYSLQFVAFLCLSLAAYFALGRIAPRYQWTVLLAASLGFYVCTGWHNLFFILLTAGSSWAVGMAFGKLEERSKAARKAASDRAEKKEIKARFNHYKWLVLLAALVLNFGVLSYIKYWNVLLDGLGMGESFLASSLLLPLGLSFYTFQSMGYLIDAYNGKVQPERNPLKYLLFVSWFPQLIQGPINRFDQLAEQLCAPRHFDAAGAKRALLLIGFGMLKKFVVADMLVKTIAACLDQVTPGTPGSIIVFGILLYSAQQYGDFSGGIDMVRGVSQLFGVRMAENFRQPYFSVSLGDFWRRWHITLGAWMRDYVFYPFALTDAMRRLGKWAGAHLGEHWGRTLPASVANILVFFLVGLWHGAGPVQRPGHRGGRPCRAAVRPHEDGVSRERRHECVACVARGPHVHRCEHWLVLRPHLRLRRLPAGIPQHAVQLQCGCVHAHAFGASGRRLRDLRFRRNWLCDRFRNQHHARAWH